MWGKKKSGDCKAKQSRSWDGSLARDSPFHCQKCPPVFWGPRPQFTLHQVHGSLGAPAVTTPSLALGAVAPDHTLKSAQASTSLCFSINLRRCSHVTILAQMSSFCPRAPSRTPRGISSSLRHLGLRQLLHLSLTVLSWAVLGALARVQQVSGPCLLGIFS